MRGVVPIGVTAPRGATSVTLSPACSDSVSASLRPMATPCPSSNPSSEPCLMFLAIEVRLLRSSARMPRTNTPEALNGEDASACPSRSEEHTSELQSQSNLVCRLLLEKKKKKKKRARDAKKKMKSRNVV